MSGNRLRRNKYGAIRTTVDGITFDSKAEAQRYVELKLMEKVGLVASIRVHPRFPIIVNHIKVCSVILDFSYYYLEDKLVVHEDIKGKDNALSRLKRKLVEAYWNIKVTVVRKRSSKSAR